MLVRLLSNEDNYLVYALTGNPNSLKSELGNNNTFFCGRWFFHENGCAEDVFSNACIINCAFPRNTDGANVAIGLEYINSLFCAAKDYHSRAVINISSQSVYSQKRTHMADENTSLCLESEYAIGKYATELMLNSICRDLPHTNLRMSSLIGPYFNQRITNRLIDSIISEKRAIVSINKRRFGFMDVRDASDAILSLIGISPMVWKGVYCVGTGQGYSLMEIADELYTITKNVLGFFPEIQKIKTEEYGDTSVSGDLLKRDTGFYSRLSLYDSLQNIFLSKLDKSRK